MTYQSKVLERSRGLRPKGYKDKRQRRKSCWDEEALVQWMATPNVVTKGTLKRSGWPIPRRDRESKGLAHSRQATT